MNNKVDSRIQKIKSERENLLKMVRASILEHKERFAEKINEVVSTLKEDEESVKKYEAMVRAQELIASLTEEILAAKTVEDIINIRKRLNYYISKIKAELKKREVDQAVLDEYQEKATVLRKEIAKYIRVLKRENNLSEIDRLYGNYDNLSLEEMEALKKSLRREVSYNTRNINGPKKKEITPIIVAEEEVTPTEPQTGLVGIVGGIPQLPYEFEPFRSIDDVEYEEVGGFLAERVESLTEQYGIADTRDYFGHGVVSNVFSFLCNIPRYVHNKKAIKAMEKDYFMYYRGGDLVSYMEYLKQRNSIRQGLKCIFNRSYLFSEEGRYLNDHEECCWWIYNFCLDNNLDLPIQKHLA